MAGLNDDVDEGLPPEDEPDENGVTLPRATYGRQVTQQPATLPDGVVPPNNNSGQPEPRKVTLITSDDLHAEEPNTNGPTAEELFGRDVVPGKLPNLKADFVVITQKRDSLTDLSQAAGDIRNKAVISQEDARTLDSIAPGLIHEDNPIEYYTQQPSQTNFRNTLTSVEKRLLLEKNELDTLFKRFVVTAVTEAANSFTDFDKNLKPSLVASFNEIKISLDANLTDINEKSKSFLFNDRCTMNELLNIPVADIETRKVTSDPILIEVITKFKLLLSDLLLSHYIWNGNLNVNITESINNTITLNDLMKFYSDHSDGKAVFDLQSLYQKQRDLSESIQNEYNEAPSNEKKAEIFDLNERILSEVSLNLETANSLTSSIINLNKVFIILLSNITRKIN